MWGFGRGSGGRHCGGAGGVAAIDLTDRKLQLLTAMIPVFALALLLPSPDPIPVAPCDDLAALVAELEGRLDDADEDLIAKIADLGTRASMEALVGLYGKMRSVFMRREILRALPVYDGNPEAEQPALQQLLDVAVGAKERELRTAALEGLDRCRNHGKTFLRMAVESSAQDDVRERALEMHVGRHNDDDLLWYRELYLPPAPEQSKEDDGKRRRRRKEEDPAPQVKQVHPLESLRVLAFLPIAGTLGDSELLQAFSQDPNQEIKVASMNELAARDYKGLKPLATDILDNISLPAPMRVQGAEVLTKVLGDEVADLFIDLAKKQEVTPDLLRRRMGELLAELRDDGVDRKTEKLLGKGKPHQRLFALTASQFNEESKVVKKLIKALTDKDEKVWRLAVDIARQRRFEEAEKELSKQLGKAKKDEERMVPLLTALSAIRGGDGEWQATLEGHATGEDREVRNAALRALAAHGGLDYLSVLCQALDHDDWSTRLAALRGLESMRVSEVLGPIVERMNAEDGRLLVEFADTLWRLTGRPYRTRSGAWASWFEEEGEGFELIEPRALAKIELEEENRRLRQITKVEFFGVRIESTRVIFIVDVSGSMNEALRGEYIGRPGEMRMDVAKRELKGALKVLEPTALYNIITFSSGVDAWLDGVIGSSEKSRDDAIDFVDRLGAGGGTNLYEAVQAAFEDPDVDTIILLSDGEPTVGPVIQPAVIRSDVARWNEHRGVKIHSISVGGSLRVLEWLAGDSGGTYVEFQ